jgi:hypothetical protein
MPRSTLGALVNWILLPLHRLVGAHEQAIFSQAQQSAACNATHDLESRLARWLLRAADLHGGNELPFTQEFLAEMLGVRRTSVNVIAHTLQHAGMLKYARGHKTFGHSSAAGNSVRMLSGRQVESAIDSALHHLPSAQFVPKKRRLPKRMKAAFPIHTAIGRYSGINLVRAARFERPLAPSSGPGTGSSRFAEITNTDASRLVPKKEGCPGTGQPKGDKPLPILDY